MVINRKAIISHNLLAEHLIPDSNTKSHKLIVRLHRTSRIKLSNRDMKDLITDCQAQILGFVLSSPVDELILSYGSKQSRDLDLMENTNEKNRISIPMESQKGWKCVLVIPIKVLETIRSVLEGIPVEHSAIRSTRFGSGSSHLLVRDLELEMPEILEEEDDTVPGIINLADLDNKKSAFKVNYLDKKILTKGVQLVVQNRPRNR